MADSKSTIIKLILGNDKFELLVKPDQALEYKLGKRSDLSSVLISDEIYSDANDPLAPAGYDTNGCPPKETMS